MVITTTRLSYLYGLPFSTQSQVLKTPRRKHNKEHCEENQKNLYPTFSSFPTIYSTFFFFSSLSLFFFFFFFFFFVGGRGVHLQLIAYNLDKSQILLQCKELKKNYLKNSVVELIEKIQRSN